MSAPISTEDAIAAGVDAAWEAEGYRTDGQRDLVKFRAAIAAVVMPAKVIGQGDLHEKAVTRGAVIRAVFPNLTSEDDAISEKVRARISSQVWHELRMDQNGSMQSKVEAVHGNGYVLLRVEVQPNGTDRLWAVCITQDHRLIDKWLARKIADATQRQVSKAEQTYTMLIQRQPQYGKRWMASFDRAMRTMVSSAHEKLALTLEAATSEPSPESDDSEQAA